jgi:GntR family transcriptional regulator/MocR family aminotransferase
MTWDLTLQLQPGERGPVFLQIARTIADDIQRGRLQAGEWLPSTRKLAAQLGVHRKTVTAGYLELEREGWITSEPARGSYVSRALPARMRAPRRTAPPERAGFDLPPVLVPDVSPVARRAGMLLLLGGVPDLRLLPQAELTRAYRRVLRAAAGRRLLDYCDPQGDPRLRSAIAELLVRTRGIRATADVIAVVRGSQQGLYLAARALLQPGDRVAVESLGHPTAWGALRVAGLRLEPVPIDGEGLDVAALETLCARRRIKAVYLTPHHQLPTTVTLTAARRVRLIELARRQRMVVLEDDYDHEFQYEGRPVLPLASADRHGVVVYLGTLSKVLAPGLRLGFLAATPDVVRRIASYRVLVDQQGDHVVERAVADLLEDGEIERHTRRARRAYRARRDALCEALQRHLPELEYTPPHGGMAVWARAPGRDVDAWVQRAHDAGVAFQPASRFTFDGKPRELARIGFAACDERELTEAARRLAATY